jgi:predicted transcriptional regulator
MALGDLERVVMNVLWDAGEPLTVRQVHESIGPRRDLAYTTVMTVLHRLAKKGVVVEQKADRAYRYAATQSREQMTAAVMLDALNANPDQDAALAYFFGRLPPDALAAAIEAAKKR